MKKLYLLLLMVTGTSGFAQFSAGNLAFLQADASANNTTGSIIEINTTSTNQSAITTIAIDGTGANALRFSGSATSTGYVANSNDGSLLCFTGANSTNTSANVNTLNPRAVGVLNAAQAFSLPTTYTGASGNQTRGATTVDNAAWFIADQGGLYTNASTTPSPTGNFRSIKAFGGVVYASSASSTSTVIQVSTISAATGGTLTGLPGLTNNANLQDFYLVSSGTNGSAFDILYVLSATSNAAGTISKFSLVSGTWTDNGSYTTTFGGFGIAAQKASGGSALYVSTGQGALTANSVIKLTDAAGYNTSINITTANNITLYTAPAGKIVKGIAFAPVAQTSPAVSPNPVSINFPNTTVGSVSAAQTVTLTAFNLTPASGTLTVTAPNANFQLSNNGTTWVSSLSVSYSNSGATIGNFQVRFSPQSSGAQSGNITITGGGLSTAATVAVSGFGDNSLSLTFSASTTSALNPPYVSGVINDATDPAQQQGVKVDVQESGVAIIAANYTLTASSSNTSVVPNANINITKADGLATIKLTPAAVGYADITLTLSKGGNTKTLVIRYAASTSTLATTRWHTVISDASAAIAIDDNYMIIGDDEHNMLYMYNRNQSGLPVKTFDYNQGNILALTDGSAGAWKELDVEAGVSSPTVAGKTYWLGSMSNSSSFNNKPNRNRLIAINYSGTGTASTFTNAGFYSNLRQQLITWGDANGYNFTASAADGKEPKIIDGFNVEGMVFGPDNTTLYIGFRAPLVPLANRTKAVIAPILNFETFFNNGSPVGNPTIGSPIELDLGGRGIRDIIRLANGSYIIIAGSYDATLVPAIYTWTGNAANAPVLTSFNVSGLNLEAVLPVNENGVQSTTKLQVITDNGSKVYYNDAVESKDLTQDNYKKFSSDVVSSSGALPVQFVYFSASRKDKDASLTWQVGNSDNIRSFEVMRSLNGRDFVTIATVPAVLGQGVYSYIDNNLAGNKFYYNIKAKEISAREYLSNTRMINIDMQDALVHVYPNPVINKIFTIDIDKPGDKTINIYAGSGILYKQFNFSEALKNINTYNWPKGYYVVQIINNDGTATTERLIIK